MADEGADSRYGVGRRSLLAGTVCQLPKAAARRAFLQHFSLRSTPSLRRRWLEAMRRASRWVWFGTGTSCSMALAIRGTTQADLIDFISKQKAVCDFEPGSRWAYSNSNVVLLGGIIEKVSGRTYRQYMMESVFSKAGLTHTAVDRNADVVPGRVSGYAIEGGGAGGFLNGPHLDMSYMNSVGGIGSTVRDLAAWFAALFDGHVVTRTSLDAMTAPAPVNDGRLAGDALHAAGASPGSMGYYGLGIRAYELDGHRVVGHGGSFARKHDATLPQPIEHWSSFSY